MKLERFKKCKSIVESADYVNYALLDEDYIPPNKSASFTPYDMVICADNPESALFRSDTSLQETKKDLEEELIEILPEEHYDTIVGTEVNSTSEDGEYLVYISLETFEEYKSRW